MDRAWQPSPGNPNRGNNDVGTDSRSGARHSGSREPGAAGSRSDAVIRSEVVLAMGAIHTPKVLMLSGVGDEHSLRPRGLPVVQHLPGVGRNFQNHLAFTCVWETPDRWPPDAVASAVVYWPSRGGGESPDFFACHAALPIGTAENFARFGLPMSCWSMHGGLTHPKSRGALELTGPDPDCPLRIIENGLSEPEDLAMARELVEGLREVGNSTGLRPFFAREFMPGDLDGDDLDQYLRDAAMSFWHQ